MVPGHVVFGAEPRLQGYFRLAIPAMTRMPPITNEKKHQSLPAQSVRSGACASPHQGKATSTTISSAARSSDSAR